MSYSIETRTVTEFVTDSNIRLPRFQRKSTWKPSQNFELAISMFKEYPLGVIVINDEKGTSWLLDGRQRRNALKELRDNPDLVYDAAKTYIKFKSNEPEDSLKEKFWQKVDSYLVNYAAMSDEEIAQAEGNEDMGEEDPANEDGINRARQQEGLKTLLDIILMVHQKKKDKESGLSYGQWERLFKLDKFLSNLEYATKRDNYRINPEQLHEFLLKIGKKAKMENRIADADFFMEYVDEKIKEGQESAFKMHIERHWDDMARVISVVMRSEELFRRARIGVISIKNVTPLDAQNIFSRINSGGTPLSPEELISAKPFWNEPILDCNTEVRNLVRDLYRRLDVSVPEDGRIVRWDIIATLMNRIKDNKLFFESYVSSPQNNANKPQAFPQISIGFRLISAWFMKGVSKVHINALEQNKEIRWPESINRFVNDFNCMCSVLINDDFFKSLALWDAPMIKMVGASATFDFCAIMFQHWCDLESPCHNGAELFKFYRHARALFDNIVFEYATGFWKGSGDSKMAKHLRAPNNRFIPLDNSTWKILLTEICTNGTYNGQPIARANIEPLIYYQMVLRGLHYPLETQYEIDHILPQSRLKNNHSIPSWFMDSVINLSLLPRKDNNDKNDRLLLDLKGTCLAHTVSSFTGICIDDFEKFSNTSNIPDLIELREALWIRTFGDNRLNTLNT